MKFTRWTLFNGFRTLLVHIQYSAVCTTNATDSIRLWVINTSNSCMRLLIRPFISLIGYSDLLSRMIYDLYPKNFFNRWSIRVKHNFHFFCCLQTNIEKPRSSNVIKFNSFYFYPSFYRFQTVLQINSEHFLFWNL